MGRVAIATDSNSGITQKEAKELGIQIISELDFLNMLGGNENADQGTE